MEYYIKHSVTQTVQSDDAALTIDEQGNVLSGSGGGKKQSAPPPFTRTPDSLRSEDTVEVILGLCEGPIAGLLNGGKSFYVGDTPLQNNDNSFNFEYFELYFKPGAPQGMEPPIVPRLGGFANSYNVGVALNQGSAVTRQSPDSNINAIDLRFVVSQLFSQTDEGIFEFDLSLSVKVKRNIDPSWGAPLNEFEVYLRGKTTSAYVKEIRIPVAQSPDYFWQVQITKLSPDTTTGFATDVAWESYQTIFTGPRQFADTTTTQIVARATSQFSSVPQFSGVYRGKIVNIPTNYFPDNKTYLGNWNGSFKQGYTNNPAWCLHDFVMNSRYGISSINPVFMDKFDVYEAGQWCDEMVPDGKGGSEPRFTYNDYIQELTFGIERARYIAGVFGATVFDDGDGNIVLKMDRNDAATHLFTQENIGEEGFTYSFTDINTRFNDITVSFKNPELLYEEDRRRIVNQSHINTYGRIPYDFVAVGCISESEALRRAYYKLNSGITETMMVSFRTNRLGSAVEPFDVILVSDPDLGYALSGRVKSLSTNRDIVFLRDPLFLEAGVNYRATFRLPNALFEVVITAPSTGLVTQFNLQSPLPAEAPEYCTFTLAQYNGSNQPTGIGAPKPFRVMGIREVDGSPDQIEITALDLNRNKFADSENQVVSTPTDYSALGDPSNILGPTNVTFTAVYSKSDNEVWTVVNVTLPHGQYRYYSGEFEVWTRKLVGGQPQGSYQIQTLHYGDTLKGHPGGPHEVRILPKNTFGQTPPLALMPTWLYTFANTSEIGIPPKAPIALQTFQTHTGFYVRWLIEEDQQDLVHHFTIREGETFETSVILASNIREFFYLIDPMEKRQYKLWVSAVSIAFVEGPAETISFENLAPQAPTNLRVEVAYETIMIYFDRMTELDIIGYRIQYRKVGTPDWLDMSPSGLFDQGESDTAYEFRVAAQDPLTPILNDEIWSNPISARTRSTLSVEKAFDEVRQLTSVNLVRNGSFEQDLIHWEPNPVGSAVVISDPAAPYADPLNGTSKVLHLTEGILCSKKFVVRPNRTYTASVDLLLDEDAPGENHCFSLVIYDQDKNVVKTYLQDNGKRVVDPEELDAVEWRRFASTFVVPENGVWATFKLMAQAGGIYADGVQVQRGNAATPFNPHVSEELSAEDLGIIDEPDTTTPNAPTGLTASAAFRTVTLSWSAPTNKPVALYRIYRDNVVIGTSAATVFSDTAPLTGELYSYYVVAVDRNGNVSGNSNTVQAQTIPLSSADYADLSIVSAKIADAAIDDAKIANLSAAKITSGVIEAGIISVGSDRLRLEGTERRLRVLDESNVERIRLGRLGNGPQNYGIQIRNAQGNIVVDADGLGLNTVGLGQMLPNSVNSAQVVTGAINADKIAANSVIASKIQSNAVEARHVLAGSITADKIAVAQLSALTADLGEVTAGTLRGAGLASNTNFWNLNTGEFWIGPPDQSAYIRYNPISGKILLKGEVEFQASDVDWESVRNRPMNLASLDPDSAVKLGGIQAGADKTSLNTAKDVVSVGGQPASNIAFWASDPAVRINQQSTTINGGKITTGSITANRLSVAELSSISANIGTVTAGTLRNTTNTARINLAATGLQQFINCNNKFIVDAQGNVFLSNLQVNGNAIIDGTLTANKIAHGSLSANYEGNDQVFIPNMESSEILIIQAVKYSLLAPMQGGHPGLGPFNNVIVTRFEAGNGPMATLGGGPFLRAGLVQGGNGWLIDNTGTMTGLIGNITLRVYYQSGSWYRLRGVKLYVTRLRR